MDLRTQVVDGLTGLPVREHATEILRTWLDDATDPDSEYYHGGILTIMCDGDGLRKINKLYSHEHGNEFLRGIAERLRVAVPLACDLSTDSDGRECPRHLIARNGGDEFIVAIRGLSENPDIAAKEAEEKLVLFETVMHEAEISIYSADEPDLVYTVTLSFGGFVTNGTDTKGQPLALGVLLDNADSAMRYVKERRDEALDGNHYAMFTSDMGVAAARLLRQRQLYYNAVRNNTFRLVCMPVFEVESQLLYGLEVLVRLQDPSRDPQASPLSSDHLEDMGVTLELLSRILPRVLDQLLEWRRTVKRPLPFILINVTPRLLTTSRYYEAVVRCLESPQYRDVVGYLVFEFTEAASLKVTELVERRLRQIKRSVKVALDDFGAGNANVGTLRDFEWDVVKLDKDFLLRLNRADDSLRVETIVQSCAEMVLKNLPHARFVIEGVENQEHDVLLRRMITSLRLPTDVLGQGYYYGQAMPVADLIKAGLI